jgi:hypothetical protein
LNFTESSQGLIELQVTDHGEVEGESLVLLDRAATVADLGLLVRPRLCLTRQREDHWARWAEAYRLACHGAAVSFLRPLARADASLPAAEDFPDPGAVAQFLLSVYEGCKHDLTRAYPFSAILQALTHGTDAVPACGASNTAALDFCGRVLPCEHGSENAERTEAPAHSCSWAPFCSALGKACSVLRHRNPLDAWLKWERLFCPAIKLLMPRILTDLVEAASSQRFLEARPANERLRMAACDGELRVWTEVIPGHSLR